MKRYAVKEIFYSVQGEGMNAGRAAVFVRFAGCNLWNGLESGRATGAGGCSAWCDTDFVGADAGTLTAEELMQACVALWPASSGRVGRLCILTGGEPTLQADEPLVRSLQVAGFDVAMETNGTRPVPAGLDWITVSPKDGAEIVAKWCDELKVVVPQETHPLEFAERIHVKHKLVQPKAGDPAATAWATAFVAKHPEWRLSLQLHKFIGVR